MPRWNRKIGKMALAAFLGLSAVYAAGLETVLPAYAAQTGSASGSTSIQSLQADIKRHLNLRESSFTLLFKGRTDSLSDWVGNTIEEVLNADDALGYTVSSYRWNTSSTKSEATIKVTVVYWENAKQTEFVISRTKEIAKDIIKPGMNPHQKVKAVHDWVLLNVAYDRSLVQHSAYAALTRGVTVCQGYALLTYRLLNEAGIENRILEGAVPTGPHAWNLVKLNGQWYHLDTTFDDPVPDLKGRTTYSYYLINDKQIKKDHKWTASYPPATATYAKTLTALKSSDKKNAAFYAGLEDLLGYRFLQEENTVKTLDELAARISKAIKAGESTISVRWTGRAAAVSPKLLLKAAPLLSEVTTLTTPFPLGEPGDVILKVTFK